MKQALLIGMMILFLFGLSYAMIGNGVARDRFYNELPSDGKRLVLLFNHSGNVVVNAIQTNKITIAATRTVRDGTEKKCQELLQKNPIEITDKNGIYTISSKLEADIPFSYSSNVTLTVPTTMKVEIHTTNGQVIYNSESLPYLISTDPVSKNAIGNVQVIALKHTTSVSSSSSSYSIGGISVHPFVRWWNSLKNEIPVKW